MRRRRDISIGATAAALALVLVFATPARADNGTNTSALRGAVSAENIGQHLRELQTVADRNGDNRAAGTTGYEASAAYVESKLRAAGYKPVRQAFSYDQFVIDEAELAQLTPSAATYAEGDDFAPMSYSASGDVTAAVSAVDINLTGDRMSTSGCEPADFAGFTVGHIALIQRGSCSFRIKVDNAAAAGASAVIVFNQGDQAPDDDRLGLFFGTLNPPQTTVPAVSTTFALGETLARLGELTMRLSVHATLTNIRTFNVIADTAGRPDRTVVVGAHLDSVPDGPGINDNGTGSAAILETAIQLAELGIKPVNRVRFAFWGGEEDGLIGSDHYVSQLTPRQIKDHAVNLNFDMVGSPNYVRFVYDGDGSAFGTAGPTGSARVERVFRDYFASQGLATEASAFDGRSDYSGFIDNGIPAGGLFTGAEGIKTTSQAERYGGNAGQPYDPCYHQACDAIDNVDAVVLEQMADAIAHATLTFAATTSAINGTDRGNGSGQAALQYKGPLALR